MRIGRRLQRLIAAMLDEFLRRLFEGGNRLHQPVRSMVHAAGDRLEGLRFRIAPFRLGLAGLLGGWSERLLQRRTGIFRSRLGDHLFMIRSAIFEERLLCLDGVFCSSGLIGFGGSPTLSAEAESAWKQAGGITVTLPAQGEFSHLKNWCAVVRPDRIVLHDGHAADASQLIQQALLQLRGAST